MLTNYLPFVLCVTYLLTMTLPSVVSAYLFAVIRYGYLFHMALKKPVEQVFDVTRGNVFTKLFGIPKFILYTSLNLFSRPYNFLTMLLVLAYTCFNPLSLLVKIVFGSTISAFTFGLVNSGLELAITTLFVKMIYDSPSISQENRIYTSEPVISGLTGILLMGWLVHDEMICAMPFLTPVFNVFTTPMMQMFIVTSCMYSFSCWITDNLYRCFTRVNNHNYQGPRPFFPPVHDPHATNSHDNKLSHNRITTRLNLKK